MITHSLQMIAGAGAEGEVEENKVGEERGYDVGQALKKQSLVPWGPD